MTEAVYLYRYTYFNFSRFGHSCFVLELVASNDLHSNIDVRYVHIRVHTYVRPSSLL